ncbi:MAG TPA: allophanate hydrolase subunit 1 [Marmoricola sp.]|jgi:KipI family sensor histidine kinase inhibitor|nr:allophanate hydrolase subunit 1 [Marmoricola sp.]
MDARRVGEHAVLVECADLAEVATAYALLRGRADQLGAVEVVPAARTVLLDGLPDPGWVVAELSTWARDPDGASRHETGPLVEIPTRYDGPDLDEVARQWDMSTAEVIWTHQSVEYTVAFCGFAPGFAYCTGLPAGLEVARRADPRPKVPAGSVALAGEFTSIYPSASPGGWQLIGSTEIALWRADSDEPALLAPGCRIRFTETRGR